MPIRVTVWNEFLHEQNDEKVRAVYPLGIHQAIAEFLGRDAELAVRTATLDQPDNGLPQAVLDQTDVLLWWGHMGHQLVDDMVVERVYQAVLDGMGLIVLHSGHASKIFEKICGMPSHLLSWQERGEGERVFVVNPAHPIAAGLPQYFEIPKTEVYSEYFSIPAPDSLIFLSWYPSGEVFRSGFTYERGRGKIFYFSPGHETYPIYRQPEVQTVLRNAVRWAARTPNAPRIVYRANTPVLRPHADMGENR